MLAIILEMARKAAFQTALHANIYNIIHHSNKQNIRVRMWMYKTRELSSLSLSYSPYFSSLFSRAFHLSRERDHRAQLLVLHAL